jgi:glycosyltransferase involved in cell wall biosynthesis
MVAGTHAESAADAQQWIDHCVRLLRDPQHADALGRAGRQMVSEDYSFERMRRDIQATIAPRWGRRSEAA